MRVGVAKAAPFSNLGEVMKYHVHREHQGDRFYRKGDQREAETTDVAHLVRAGVLSPIDTAEPEATSKSEEKAATKPKNKAEPAVENKSQP